MCVCGFAVVFSVSTMIVASSVMDIINGNKMLICCYFIYPTKTISLVVLVFINILHEYAIKFLRLNSQLNFCIDKNMQSLKTCAPINDWATSRTLLPHIRECFNILNRSIVLVHCVMKLTKQTCQFRGRHQYHDPLFCRPWVVWRQGMYTKLNNISRISIIGVQACRLFEDFINVCTNW